MFQKIKKLLGFSGYGEAEKGRLIRSNINSSLYLSIIVILVELWMIFRIFKIAYFGDEHRTLEWVLIHLKLYVVLLAAGISVLVHALYVRWKNRVNRKAALTIQCIFVAISMAFGIYIAYMDLQNGEQMLCFITMLVFSVCVYVWRPFVTIIISSASIVILYFLCKSYGGFTLATQINLFTTWLAVNLAGIRAYHGIISK
ncbi:MAG: hypothetical protein IKR68_04270 [Lachnospiraceae bacterium]|nr:hypothetical protein [Lachnospiraceae bacterium]